MNKRKSKNIAVIHTPARLYVSLVFLTFLQPSFLTFSRTQIIIGTLVSFSFRFFAVWLVCLTGVSHALFLPFRSHFSNEVFYALFMWDHCCGNVSFVLFPFLCSLCVVWRVFCYVYMSVPYAVLTLPFLLFAYVTSSFQCKMSSLSHTVLVQS